MIKWNFNLLAFALIATICFPANAIEDKTSGDSKDNAIISHACATPLQPRKPELVTYTPVYSPTPKRDVLIAPAIPHAMVQTTSEPAQQLAPTSVSLQTENQLPGLNTKSAELEPDGQTTQSAAERSDANGRQHFLKCPLGIELCCDMLCPLTIEQLKQPQTHHAENVATNKIPNRHSLVDSEPATTPRAEGLSSLADSTSTESVTNDKQNAKPDVGWDFDSLSKNKTATNEIDANEIDANEIDANELDANELATNEKDADNTPLVAIQSDYSSGDVINFSDDQSLQTVSQQQTEGEIVTNFADGFAVERSDAAQIGSSGINPEPLPGTELSPGHYSGGLIIHPPMIQPYNRNQHTFIVENRGENLANDVTVEIDVPENCRIIATLPANSVFAKNKAVFRFEKLAAGDQVQIHINAVSEDSKPVEFLANLVSRSVFEFAIGDQSTQGQLTDVSYNHQLEEPSTSPSTRTAQNLDNGAERVRNPYVHPSVNPNESSVYR